jgi:glycosyltransferase involved in cell wall biosynthesis
MRITFCVIKGIDYGGGIERYTFELGRRLASRGHQVTVYSMRHYGRTRAGSTGMRIVDVPSLPLRLAEKLTASATAAFRTLLDPRADVVHFHHVSCGWMAWMSKLRGQKCVLQSHSLAWRSPQWTRAGSLVLRALEAVAVRSCDVLTGVSATQAPYYYDRYGVRMVHIPTGAELKETPDPREIRRLGLQSGEYVLFVGRLSPEKGAHFLVRAFRELDTSCRLVIAGGTQDRAYRRRLLELAGDHPRILFTGQVGGRLLDELFGHAALFVLPSELEGLSIALLEAMSFGRACLVSDLEENLEAIGPAGFTFRSGDVDSLVHRLNDLLHQPEQRRLAGEMARDRVRDHYGWDRITDRFEALYGNLLARRAA